MKEFNITADNFLNNRTIKYVLESYLNLSDNIIKDLKKGEFIFLNNECKTVRAVVTQGDKIKIIIPELADNNIIPVQGNLEILYEDDDIIAVNKPSNMPTHPVKHHLTDTLANLVCGYLDTNFTFRAITRLDKDTTGVVLIAKNRYSAERLNKQMRTGNIKKEYVAICTGEIPAPVTINECIKKEKENGIKRIVSPNGQPAVTHCCPIKRENGMTLVKLIPQTGRTHQLRVHCAHIGHPLYGDYLYGNEIHGCRTLLHCKKLTFSHPSTDNDLEIIAPVPSDFTIR